MPPLNLAAYTRRGRVRTTSSCAPSARLLSMESHGQLCQPEPSWRLEFYNADPGRLHVAGSAHVVLLVIGTVSTSSGVAF